MPLDTFICGNPLERIVRAMDTCRFYVNLPGTLIDLNSAISASG